MTTAASIGWRSSRPQPVLVSRAEIAWGHKTPIQHQGRRGVKLIYLCSFVGEPSLAAATRHFLCHPEGSV